MNEKSNYFVYISSDLKARPVRARKDTNTQFFNLLDGPPCITVPDKEDEHVLVVNADSSAQVNVTASIILGGRGRYVRGAAVFCAVSRDGNYMGFSKAMALGICTVLNMLGR